MCVHWAELTLPGCVTWDRPAPGEMVLDSSQPGQERPAVSGETEHSATGAKQTWDYVRLTISDEDFIVF